MHDALLKYDGLVEPTATNQGAWLTESAGALSDLHSAVLKSLAGRSSSKDLVLSSHGGSLSREEAASEAETGPKGTGTGCSGRSVCGPVREVDTGEDHRRKLCQQSGNGESLAEEAVANAGTESAASCGVATRTGEEWRAVASDPRDDSSAATATAKAVADRGRRHAGGQHDQRRARLRNLGLLLARKRQFAASRQVCCSKSGRFAEMPCSCS